MSNESTSARDEDGWFVSSFSNGNASCVEVKFAGRGTVLVRDTKDPRASSPTLSIFSDNWATLLKKFSDPA